MFKSKVTVTLVTGQTLAFSQTCTNNSALGHDSYWRILCNWYKDPTSHLTFEFRKIDGIDMNADSILLYREHIVCLAFNMVEVEDSPTLL